jgi:hypothetical protein
MKEIHAKCPGEEIAHALRDTSAPATGRELQPEIRAIVRFAAEHDRLDACGKGPSGGPHQPRGVIAPSKEPPTVAVLPSSCLQPDGGESATVILQMYERPGVTSSSAAGLYDLRYKEAALRR